MKDEPVKPDLSGSEDEEQNEQPERFESDTQKIVRRHLEDPDDVITDEDIRNVRVGMSPPNADIPALRDEKGPGTEAEENPHVERALAEKDKEKPSDNPVTPWDVIDPEP